MGLISVIGGGSWGTALAQILAQSGQNVTILARQPKIINEINNSHTNSIYLPGIELLPRVSAAAIPSPKLDTAEIIFLVVPTQSIRAVTDGLNVGRKHNAPIIICAKGVENGTSKLLSEVLEERLPNAPIAILSGPTFAAEAASGLPTAVTLACTDQALGNYLAQIISTQTFRVYYCDDIIGAQIGGAVKNVLAIACGIIAGCNLGENARAALLARGLAETVRLGLAKGASMSTLMGLSGIGDLTLTCTTQQSRNYSYGLSLGYGNRIDNALNKEHGLVEGIASACAVTALAENLRVDMPICSAVNKIIHQSADIASTINELLDRPIKKEF